MTGAVVGRDRELAVLARLRDPADPLRVVVLTGAPGAGKSTLVDVAVAAATADGQHVLVARPRATEQGLAFSVLGDLLPQLLGDEATGPDDPPAEPRRVAATVRRALAAAARDRPVLVVVDDAHWADEASLLVVPHAVRRLVTEHVALLVATRPTGGDDPWPTGPERVDLALAGLGPAALFHLVRDRLGTTLGRGDLGRLERATGGNPMYALELATAWAETDARTPVLTPTLEDLVARHVRRLGATARHVLLVAALAHDPAPSVVGSAADLPEDALDTALGEAVDVAEQRGGRIRFCHPLHAAAVVADAGPEAVRAAHGRLAEAEQGTEVVARHRAHAADGPDGEVARELAEAAEEARDRGAHPVARELMALSVTASPPDDRERDDRRLRLAAWALHDGDLQTCVEAAGAVVGAGDLAARARVLLARRALEVDGYQAAREHATAALRLAPDRRVRAEAYLVLAEGDDDLQSARSSALRARDLLDEVTDVTDGAGAGALRTSAAALVAALEHALRLPTAADRLAEAVAMEAAHPGPPAASGARFALAQQLLFASRLDEGRDVLLVLLDEARDEGDEVSEPLLLLNLGHLELRAGRLEVAGRLAREAVAVAELSGQRGAVALGMLQMANDEARKGADADAEALVAAARTTLDTFGDPWLLAIACAVTGRIRITRGDLAAAVGPLRDLVALTDRSAVLDTGWNPAPGDLAECLVQLGETDEAQAELDRLLAGVEGLDRPHVHAAVTRVRARLRAATSGVDDEALALSLSAVDAHERLGTFPELGVSLLVAGMLHRRGLQKATAHRLLGQAVEVFERCGAMRWAARAAAERDRVGLRPSAPSTLTTTEERVARLAAAGRTNPEIAAEAFLSRKTVEAVLGRVYRKLGVRSRVELVGALPPVHGD